LPTSGHMVTNMDVVMVMDMVMDMGIDKGMGTGMLCCRPLGIWL
jgi:hypothetical protein